MKLMRQLQPQRCFHRIDGYADIPGLDNEWLWEAVLDMHVFRTIGEFRERTDAWIMDHKEELPHDSLGVLTPSSAACFITPKPLVMSCTNRGRFTQAIVFAPTHDSPFGPFSP